jgi:hypothetical protein
MDKVRSGLNPEKKLSNYNREIAGQGKIFPGPLFPHSVLCGGAST